MTIVKDYLDLTEKWKKEYGEKTLVLMQVGSFFEAYGLVDKDDNIYGSEICNFAEINEMIIARKNICVGKARVVMAGFGLAQLEKYVRKMQDNGYTIPVYTQDTPSKNTTRSLHTIFSPGTYFSNETKELSNNTTCIWIHVSNSILNKAQQITIGISNIDIYTGKTSVFEFTKDYLHNPSTYDDLERYISIYNPNECILISNLEQHIIDDIINYTSINSMKIHKLDLNNLTKDCEMTQAAKNAEKQVYQQEVTKRFFPDKDCDIILNNLQSYCIAVQSFVYLLDFTYRHNPNLVNKIAEPIFENYTNRLTLANHSLKQLNIISDNRYTGKYACVGNLLNNCITPMGKRTFLYKLLNPTTDTSELNKSYDITEHMLKKDWQYYRSNMNNIRDMEKLRRKLIMKKISPKDFTIFHENLITVLSMYKASLKDKKLVAYLEEVTNVKDIKDIFDLCENLKQLIERNLDISKAKFIDDVSQERLGNYDIKNLVYINKGLDAKIDNHYKQSIESSQQFECIKKYLSDLISTHEKSAKTTDFVKIHETAKLDATLQTTKRRATFLQKSLNQINENSSGGVVNLEYKSDYSNCKETYSLNIQNIDSAVSGGNQSNMVITSPDIRKIASLINTSKNDLISALELYYYKFVEKFAEYNLDALIAFIINLDVLQCKCYIAKEYNYCKPVIQSSDKSFFDFKGIRHCLIEHLNTRELYVTNDLSLGDSANANGLLLYGTNAVGKTSFIKAIGISIIMAQAGLFVPATEFTYCPYNTLFTRILGNDNIFKGLSTFAVEMTELRTILQMADNNSLILGDELCSGTESDSALSIFVAGLEDLHQKECTFLFATHFHEIVKYSEIEALDKLKMFHMSVIFDRTTNKLVYDRKLKNGAGDSMYGLEVCKSLNLPTDFLTRAHDLRVKYNSYYKNTLALDTSRYNTKKIRDNCEICKNHIGTEVHHLEYQMDATDGFIKTENYSFHKNHAANLINICSSCHDKIHHNNVKLTVKKTSKGYELQL